MGKKNKIRSGAIFPLLLLMGWDIPAAAAAAGLAIAAIFGNVMNVVTFGSGFELIASANIV